MSDIVIENEDVIDIKISPEDYNSTINLEQLFFPLTEQESVLLILNQDIDVGPVFKKLWDRFKVKVCADGAADKLYNYFDKSCCNVEEATIQRAKHIPNYIVGDLDSITKPVAEYYLSHGVKIIKQATQYSTDFTKSIQLIQLHFNSLKFKGILDKNISYEKNYGIEIEQGLHDMYNDMIKISSFDKVKKISLLAIGAIDGRFDQTIHSICQLYKLRETDSNINLYFLTKTNLIFLLPSNGCLLTYPENFKKNCLGSCGILPIGCPTIIIESKGLKWDVKNWKTNIVTGIVSSNNILAGRDKCYINARDNLVFNIETDLVKLNLEV